MRPSAILKSPPLALKRIKDSPSQPRNIPNNECTLKSKTHSQEAVRLTAGRSRYGNIHSGRRLLVYSGAGIGLVEEPANGEDRPSHSRAHSTRMGVGPAAEHHNQERRYGGILQVLPRRWHAQSP